MTSAGGVAILRPETTPEWWSEQEDEAAGALRALRGTRGNSKVTSRVTRAVSVEASTARYPQKVCTVRRCTLSLKQHGLKAQERRYTAYGKRSTGSWSESRPEWDQLEDWVRGQVQELIQELLEEEVTEFLGRAKSARRSESDNETGYRNGYGRPRRLTLSSGTVQLRNESATPKRSSRAGCCRCSSTGPGRLLS